MNTTYQKPELQEAVLRNIFSIGLSLLSLGFSILIFTSNEFSQVATITDYSRLEARLGYSVIISISLLLIYIVDVIVLVADKQNRSLHDFIGKTYVIKK